MSNDLDLRGIDHRHEPDPQFRAALQRRVAAIVAGTDPGSVTAARDRATIDLEPTSARPVPKRTRRQVVRVILAAAAVVLVVVGALVVSSGRDSGESQRAAAPPVANGLIAFVGESDDNPATSDIYVVAPDGTGLRPLTSTAELVEYAPAWSPDGSRLAFVRSSDGTGTVSCAIGCRLVVVDSSTGVETFSAEIPDDAHDAPGDTRIPLSLTWSPDGRAIVIRSMACGVPGCGGETSVIADLGTAAFTTFRWPYHAVWSPDGEWLSLTEARFLSLPSLLLVPADLIGTGDVVDVADLAELPGVRPLPEVPGGAGPDSVEWMPDSSAILATYGQWSTDDSRWIDIVTVADGERRTLIADGSGPAVSPDGSRIAFMRGEVPDSVNEIWVAAADGGNQQRVTVSSTSPAWSPDSSLLLLSDQQGWFTVRADGTERTALGIRDHTTSFPRGASKSSGVDWQPVVAHRQ